MNDLELCKKIAEIEGLGYILKDGVFGGQSVYIDTDSHSGLRHYNPLTDDALCFQLMVKYGVRYDGRKLGGKHRVWTGNIKTKNYKAHASINKAICLAIITAHQ